jgi:hypothetical protein
METEMKASSANIRVISLTIVLTCLFNVERVRNEMNRSSTLHYSSDVHDVFL